VIAIYLVKTVAVQPYATKKRGGGILLIYNKIIITNKTISCKRNTLGKPQRAKGGGTQEYRDCKCK